MPTTLTIRRVYNVTVTIPENITDEDLALAAARKSIDAAVASATPEDVVLEELDAITHT